MDALAKTLLERLLLAGNKSAAGVRSRQAALTGSALAPYHALRSFKDKEAFETTILAARQTGAIEVETDKDNPREGYFQRINLTDLKALSRFLGQEPYADRLAVAMERLQAAGGRFPVVAEVCQKWQQMAKARGTGPDAIEDWLDALRVIHASETRTAHCADGVPLREASAQLFRDSKRIEKLTPLLDALLMGNLDTMARPAQEVWNELGLYREEQPVLMAGNVRVRRERHTALLDAPYTGLPAGTILGVDHPPSQVLSIENLTTFHSEARRSHQEPVLLLYTAGMPSPAWCAMYQRLLESIPDTVPVRHWGDVDEGGFRIAAKLAEVARGAGHGLMPWNMDPEEVPLASRRPARPKTIERMCHSAESAGWPRIAANIARLGIVVEQEALGGSDGI